MTKGCKRSISNLPLQLFEDNTNIFRFFRIVGLFPISYQNGVFKCHEKICVISRLFWFLWHVAGIACMIYIKRRYQSEHCPNKNTGIQEEFKNTTNETTGPAESSVVDTRDCSAALGDLNDFLFGCIGVLLFILADPVQNIIVKRNLNCMPMILKEVKHLENINLGDQPSRKYIVSIFKHNKTKGGMKNTKGASTESSTNICVSGSLDSIATTSEVSDVNDGDKVATGKWTICYNVIRYSILWASLLIFLVAFLIGFFKAVRPKDNGKKHDIKDEWKFFGSIFFLVFPVLTTWFCCFFIGYQQKMYKVITELPDDIFTNEDYIKDIGDYFETMQNISNMLVEKIYKFTFGINFALFVVIGTLSTFELMQGVFEIKNNKNVEFGDIIYVFPVAVCVSHFLISCAQSTNLITQQHDTLRYKLKGIMTTLLVDRMEISKENEKKFKRVELLYKNIKDFKPQAEVYGGFKVDYNFFTKVLIFMFAYAKLFYGYVGTDKKH
ncbi:unnamed protein product [Meganyctiphanes norvegica]|uniref:Gustatory receptor n=1 Tax=Meganyctiphanes norvegica TaxID=48144 RepID=A0AAV2SJ24_MEGNR